MRPIYKIMFFVSVALMVVAAVALAKYGLNLGVDFRGGSVLEVQFKDRPATDQLVTTLNALQLPALRDVSVNPTGADEVIIKSGPLTEQEHQEVLAALQKDFPKAGVTEVRFDSIGPAIGQELRSASMW